MTNRQFDVIVLGGGAAGMSAALELADAGYQVVIAEREAILGGILTQCIHNGFGLHYFKEELTGPEFAGRLIKKVNANENIEVFTGLTIDKFENKGTHKKITGYSKIRGVLEFETRAVLLAMGSRERNRGNIPIPGTRPSGIYTAGLAQRMINIEGNLPGRRVIIVGSGDIGLIMARRLTWSGADVLGVVEIQPYPAGITRNIVQCLNDFNIPLYLSHVVSEVYGKDRVSGVEILPVDGEKKDSFFISCDTVLLSVGLIPENEISRNAGIALHPVTKGAIVDGRFMTGMEGVFACGNVLHIHDLVDYCAMEAAECARGVIAFLNDSRLPVQAPVIAGANIRYTVPHSIIPGISVHLGMRSLIVSNDCNVVVTKNEEELFKKHLRHVQPSEMIRFELDGSLTEKLSGNDSLEVKLI